MLWRRSFDTPPPPIADDDQFSQVGDPRYAELGDQMPRTECLKDVIARMLPYWESAIVPDLRDGKTVLIAAHGNSLRDLFGSRSRRRSGRGSGKSGPVKVTSKPVTLALCGEDLPGKASKSQVNL